MANSGLVQPMADQDLVVNKLQQRLDEMNKIRNEMKSTPDSSYPPTEYQPGVNVLEPPTDSKGKYFKSAPNRRLPTKLASNDQSGDSES